MQRDDDRTQRARRRNEIREMTAVSDKILTFIQTGRAEMALRLFKYHTRLYRADFERMRREHALYPEVIDRVYGELPKMQLDQYDAAIMNGTVLRNSLIQTLITFNKPDPAIQELNQQMAITNQWEWASRMTDMIGEDEDIEQELEREMNLPDQD